MSTWTYFGLWALGFGIASYLIVLINARIDQGAPLWKRFILRTIHVVLAILALISAPQCTSPTPDSDGCVTEHDKQGAYRHCE